MLDFEIIWCTYELWTFHEDFLSPPALLPEQLSKSVKREQRNESDLGKNFRESTGGLRKISSKVRSADMHRTISKSMKREQRNTLDLEKWLPKETNGIKKKKNSLSTNSTNLPVRGWVSVYRSMVAALIRTTPRPVLKSSSDDLAPAHRTQRGWI